MWGSAASCEGDTALRFLSKKAVRDLITLSFTQIDRREAAGKFPKRLRLSEFPNGRVVWLEDEVFKWMQERIAEREKPH
jgi:prophage regulatory protein